MALAALHLFMHSAKWIFGFVVVELRNLANGAPPCCSVAVFARNIQIAVRAVADFFLRQGEMRQSRPRKGKNEPAQELNERVVGGHPGSSTTPSTGGTGFRSVYLFSARHQCRNNCTRDQFRGSALRREKREKHLNEQGETRDETSVAREAWERCLKA